MISVYTSPFLSHTPSRSSPTCNYVFHRQSKPTHLPSASMPTSLPFFSKSPIPRPTSPSLRVRISVDDPESPPPSSVNTNLIALYSAVTVTLAIANRVLYKLALVPMKQYPFFLAQFTTFGYVLIYFSILYMRCRSGIVTNEMLSLPKWRFGAIGFLEAVGVATGMASAAMLPGPAIPILSQAFLVWQLMFSAFLLGRRYSTNQIAGCLLVATGVVLAVASGSNAGQMLSGTPFIWPAIMIASCAFQAAASIIKEYVFTDAAKRLKGKSLDIFVVNSFGSGFQVVICDLHEDMLRVIFLRYLVLRLHVSIVIPCIGFTTTASDWPGNS